MGRDSARNEPSASAEHRQKGKGREPVSQTALADKGQEYSLWNSRGPQEKADAEFKAEQEAKQRLENKRKEKAFQDVMDASPLGVPYEASAVAEHEGGSEITIDDTLRWPMEAIKADYCVTPAVEFRLADYEAGLKTGLIERLEGLLPPEKLAAHGDGFLQRRKHTGAPYKSRFLRYEFLGTTCPLWGRCAA